MTATDASTGERGLRIIRFAAENVKRLKAVEIIPDPDGGLVIVSGKNGQGKTSVLDAIWYALGGGAALRDVARPVRDGEEEASVRLDLGDLRVVRTWKGDKTTLKVESQDGTRKFSSPQAMLDALVGRLSFDPLAFASLPPREQVTTLLSLVELPFDLDDVAARRRALFDERTVVGREVKQAESQFAALPVPRPDVPDEEVHLADLLAELSAARDRERFHGERMRATEAARADVERLRAELARAEAMLAELEEAARTQPLDAGPAVAEVEERMAAVEETNRAVRAKQEYAAAQHRLAETQRRWQALSDEIASLDAEKAEALQNAVMPIAGLSFDDDGVTYMGVPFKQCSAAEQLRVSVAMAMALNPKVRVIRITDGSLLDADNLRLIGEMAGENGFQVWIERVDDSGDVGVVIEDGRVAPKRKAVTA